MAQHDVLNNSTIRQIVNSIEVKHFTTFTIVNLVKSNHLDIFNQMKRNSPRNYQAVIGKAVKRFAIETSEITQISPPDESPARWEKK